jgi:hypothetical protein
MASTVTFKQILNEFSDKYSNYYLIKDKTVFKKKFNILKNKYPLQTVSWYTYVLVLEEFAIE